MLWIKKVPMTYLKRNPGVCDPNRKKYRKRIDFGQKELLPTHFSSI